VRAADGKWIAIAMMNKPVEALEQSWLRTKANDYASYMKVAELKANSSNNTIFADDKGEIAYLHPQFIPRRDNRFDYTKPVDGSDPDTDWKGLLPLDAAPHLLNPPNGWIFTGPTPPRGLTARSRPTTRATWTASAKTRVASTPPPCSPASATSPWRR
jgi:acyl-homoserine-lactone acylase